MCGRYVFLDPLHPVTEPWVKAAKKSLSDAQFEQLSLFEVFPSETVLSVIQDSTGKLTLHPMTWGMLGPKKNLVINARSETADVTPLFRNCKRCVLPASGYYEWSKDPKRKYWFQLEDETTMYLAGLYQEEANERRVVILTEEAKMPEAKIHNRQPVIFSSENAKDWCRNGNFQSLLQSSIQTRKMREVR